MMDKLGRTLCILQQHDPASIDDVRTIKFYEKTKLNSFLYSIFAFPKRKDEKHAFIKRAMKSVKLKLSLELTYME